MTPIQVFHPVRRSSGNDYSSDDSVADPNFNINNDLNLSQSSSDSEPSQAENPSVQLIQTVESQTERVSPKKKTRKRLANPTKWKTNELKRLRHAGKSYSTKNKVVSEKSMKPSCGEKCRQKCSTRILEEQRQKIFDAYYSLPDALHKRHFIANSIEEIKPKYVYKSSNRPRKNNLKIFLNDGKNQKIRVCQKFFLNTLDISLSIIRTVRDKLFKNDNPVPMLDDRRGKHEHHHRVEDSLKDSAREFIRNIPKIESHYVRANTSRVYIDGGRNLSDIYRDYVQSCTEKRERYINYVMFHRMFNTEFNITFFTSKKDACEDCTAYINALDFQKEEMKDRYENHLKEKELSRIEKENDKTEALSKSSLIVAVYDLQATLSCPKGEISTFYYVSKLNSYNFTIYDLKTKDVECYFWHEQQGNRGANEIGTCVYDYIVSMCTRVNEDVDLIFYSDNCTGQQKNKFFISMYLHAVATIPSLKTITHKFLIKGHTQNENDSAHSVIERNIKKSLRSGPIYSPDQYVSLIRTAKKTGKSYKVNELNYTQFKDFKSLSNDVGRNYNKNTSNETVKMNDIKILKFSKENRGCFFYKTSYSQEDFKMVKVGPTAAKGLQDKLPF